MNGLNRILVLSLNYAPEPTGTGKYTGELASFLAQAGQEVRVITAPPYYPWWKVQPPYRWWAYRRECLDGVSIWRTPLWVPKRITGTTRIIHLLSFAASSLPALLRNLPWKPDLVFTTAPSLMNAPFAFLSGRLCGAKTWLHIQDFELDAAVGLGILPVNSTILKLLKGIERWILRRFDIVSTISERMMDRLYEKGMERDRVKMLPNWVEMQSITPLAEKDSLVSSMKADLRLPEDQVVALYSGNMGRKQGLEVILEAAVLLQERDDIVFVLCGEGAARSELVVKAEGLRNVVFGPLQPPESLNALLNTADIHLLPQRAHAADLVMPSKLYGMLASGRPVVATAYPGTELAETVSGCGIVTTPGDAAGLALAVRELADSPEARRAYGREGRARVMGTWSRDAVLQDMLDEMVRICQG